MSLWTPGGEVPIERQPARPSAPEPTSGGAFDGDLDLESLSPEERAQAEAMVAEMAEAQARIAGIPGDGLVAQHAIGLYELAAIKLNASPPQLDDARLAIDALAAIVDAVGDRLGEHVTTLREALTVLQAAWVQVRDETTRG